MKHENTLGAKNGRYLRSKGESLWSIGKYSWGIGQLAAEFQVLVAFLAWLAAEFRVLAAQLTLLAANSNISQYLRSKGESSQSIGKSPRKAKELPVKGN
ncbi:hypothetical protein C7Y47_12920 [Lysinibacillus sphaericus]|uniref:Uncharacterized protein n=1 Tax=Lysinibacillus sphaericus TaxID=1421 RepID=A0A544UHB9_LYSSH|nr:hypothetical protein [Lysinibacillus sp. SDF0037]TQR32221.1 hypothetical protein C7Y47_12920 [Lysinibacillus sp. SDF0037]